MGRIFNSHESAHCTIFNPSFSVFGPKIISLKCQECCKQAEIDLHSNFFRFVNIQNDQRCQHFSKSQLTEANCCYQQYLSVETLTTNSLFKHIKIQFCSNKNGLSIENHRSRSWHCCIHHFVVK